MSEPNSPSDPTPPVPPAPSFTYGEPAPPAPQQPVAPPPPAQPAAADPLPPPAYGERIPGYQYPQTPAVPTPGAPAYGAPAYAAPYGAPGAPQPRRRRTWDVVLTIILFVLGLFGMGIGLIYAALFADPVLVKEIFDEAFRQYGLGGWNGTVGAAPAVIAVSHVVLYLVAVGVGILLLVTKRIAFWVPLVAGVVAAIIFWGALYSVVLSDPSILNMGM